MFGAKDLRFIGREFHKWGDELLNERSANLSLVDTDEGKGTDNQRNEFCREFDICEPVTLVRLHEEDCV